ncbi:conserved hypothetical protein [Trichinella spiralis]|uniref:hypothetical protein n=1 Tax=Trichinella spiralis TaxID=6334 RepID=UPI0001EFD3A6|nr:conserved hypothetical protein [Trichinella spiralis]
MDFFPFLYIIVVLRILSIFACCCKMEISELYICLLLKRFLLLHTRVIVATNEILLRKRRGSQRGNRFYPFIIVAVLLRSKRKYTHIWKNVPADKYVDLDCDHILRKFWQLEAIGIHSELENAQSDRALEEFERLFSYDGRQHSGERNDSTRRVLDRDFLSAFTSLSHSSLVAAESLFLPAMIRNSAAESSALRGSFPIAVRAITLRQPPRRSFVGGDAEQIDFQFSHCIVLPVGTFFQPLHCYLVVSVRGGQACRPFDLRKLKGRQSDVYLDFGYFIFWEPVASTSPAFIRAHPRTLPTHVVHRPHDFIPESLRYQNLLSSFLSRESAAISTDEAIFLHSTAPLMPQHVHVAATLHRTFHRPARAINHCHSSWISGSACWAANNWLLNL